ncbi:MAG: phosphatidylserine decarboxylase [Candidatus Thermoplasmatota archaeon]
MMKIAKGGFRTIFYTELCCLLCILGAFFVENLLRMVFIFFAAALLLLVFLLFVFFRDPERKTGDGIVAVADGIIRDIVERHDPDIGDCILISTFLNIHNVHVTRIPLEGTVIDIRYCQGSHIPAFKKESERNEQMTLLLQTSIGVLKIVLIAGTIARRIMVYVQHHDALQKGQRFGLIKFGSRVDVFLPRDKINVCVQKKDTVKAGVDKLADIKG